MSPDIRLQRWFEAPLDVGFDAYTDPDAQRALRTGGPDWVLESECDLRVGGEWIIRFGPSSAPYVDRNVFHAVERSHRLVYASTTEWPDGSHIESLMEIDLRWLDGRTLLTLTQREVPSGDLERGFTDGWNESWTRSWQGSRHGPRPERTERTGGSDGQGHVRDVDVA